MPTRYLACDLGAESGRLVMGTLADGRLTAREIHRFANVPAQSGGSLHWNIEALFEGMKAGLTKAAATGESIASISTDSWGLDYLLFNSAGEVIAPTFHYRDARTERGVAAALARVDRNTIFAETGIQFMPMNTVFQLAAESPERLANAYQVLLVADGFNYLLTGVAKCEESLASTSQLYNPRTRSWSKRLLDALHLPKSLFAPVEPSGTWLGPLRHELAAETGLANVDVIASCSHDTGAAVAAVPALDGNWAYISSGTWSLMGVERAEPVITERCRELNFTNEIGYGSTVRLLKNIVGLWLVQECRRHWAAEGHEYDYAKLTQLAGDAQPFASLIDASDARFIRPGDMPAKIAQFCRETGQRVPETPGEFIRCALESLALLYRRTLVQLEELTGERIERIHIVGGGSRNDLLNQFTADACGLPVVAGPTEATAIGNILVQAITRGDLRSLGNAREVVAQSFPVRHFKPCCTASWDAVALPPLVFAVRRYPAG